MIGPLLIIVDAGRLPDFCARATFFRAPCHTRRSCLVKSVQTNQRRQMMTVVTDPFAAAPQLMKQWMGVSLAVQDSLEPSLIELVKIRASILNACANCINMHTAEARAKGETEQRIYLLAAWHEAPVYTPRERAALAWTDALTRLSEGHTQQGAKDGLEAHFTAEEQVKLTLMINIINGWNRLAVGFGLWLDVPAAKAA
jgi:AhpD family alkylhydroperoxidase